jgi:hypothetical protein
VNLQLGQVVIATRKTAVCDVGERGIVYEQYDLGEGPAVSVIFERGRYDGFSPDEQRTMLAPAEWGGKPLFYKPAQSYMFSNVMKLWQDFERGAFRFWPDHQ